MIWATIFDTPRSLSRNEPLGRFLDRFIVRVAASIVLLPSVIEMPEDQLLTRCRQGDLEAFSRVHAEHHEIIFRHAYHLLGRREDALDVAQETFVRAFLRMAGFRGRCSLRAWLLRICTNECRDQTRRRRRRPEVPLDTESWEALPGGAEPHRELEAGETAGLVQAALLSLSPSYRELIVLRDLEGIGTAEIAAIVGCLPASVPVKLFRARSRNPSWSGWSGISVFAAPASRKRRIVPQPCAVSRA